MSNSVVHSSQTLTTNSALADLDGMGGISYQWQTSSNGGSTWTDVAVSSPKAAQPLFGDGCRERSAAKRNVESRHLSPINDLRLSANSFSLPASSPHGDWLVGRDALDAANDTLYQIAA